MIRHVVMFRWNDQATEPVRERARQELAALPERIDAIRTFDFGDDAGLREGNFDLAVVADFDDADGYRTYADHPAHLAVIRDHLLPYLGERAAVQFELPSRG
jgi:putative component of toxin-antitoxin plasmid stabilization module